MQVNVPGVQGRGRAVAVAVREAEDVVGGRVLVRRVVGVVVLEVEDGGFEEGDMLVEVLGKGVVRDVEEERPVANILLVEVLAFNVVAELAT